MAAIISRIAETDDLFMKNVEQCVETLCEKGCQSVRQDIQKLEAGETLPETDHLSRDELGRVVEELKAIMAVYGDSCRVSF